MKNLIIRTVTGVLFVALLVGGIACSPITFALLFALVTVLTLWEFSTIDFCQIADAVILDYSAVMFEVALLGKPMYFYTFDYDSYMESRDVYIDFRKYIPGVITGEAQKLAEAIEHHDSDAGQQETFRDRMVSPSRSGSYTRDAADFFEIVLAERRQRERR